MILYRFILFQQLSVAHLEILLFCIDGRHHKYGDGIEVESAFLSSGEKVEAGGPLKPV
jgi:hypothetical protein